MNKLQIPEGYEIRGELIKLYPDTQTWQTLSRLKEEVRNVTNHIVSGREHVKNARKAYALKQGLVGPPPTMPDKPYLPTPVTDEEKSVVKAAYQEYKKHVKAVGPEWIKWYKQVDAALKDRPEFDWRKDTYQQLRKIYCQLSNAVLIRDTVKRVSKTKSANYKRRTDHVPLVWGNGDAVKVGRFFGTRRGVPWYNAMIQVNGMSILGRLRRPLPGRLIQGVTLVQQADGWYAMAKCIVPMRSLPTPTKGSVGIDVGQIDHVAMVDDQSTIYTQPNERDRALVSRIAALQSKADLSQCQQQRQIAKQKIGRLHQKLGRRLNYWLNAELLPRLQQYSVVFVERLAKGFKSDRGGISAMHKILDAIKLRLGDRVREVECAYTSQTCSRCGNVNKSARKGKDYTCVVEGCGHRDDADLNAARNILAKGTQSLALS